MQLENRLKLRECQLCIHLTISFFTGEYFEWNDRRGYWYEMSACTSQMEKKVRDEWWVQSASAITGITLHLFHLQCFRALSKLCTSRRPSYIHCLRFPFKSTSVCLSDAFVLSLCPSVMDIDMDKEWLTLQLPERRDKPRDPSRLQWEEIGGKLINATPMDHCSC